MHQFKNHTPLFAIAALALEVHDALRVPEPCAKSSVCFAWNETARTLHAPDPGEGGGGGGGDDKRFTQADLDKVLGERLAKEREKFKDYDDTKKQLKDLSDKLAAAENAANERAEQESLKGKTEVEKVQHQLDKANALIKKMETEHGAALKDRDDKLTAAGKRFTDHVTSSAVKDALLGAKGAPGAIKHAASAFVNEAQFEFGEDGVTIARITVGGKQFDKPAEAAAHWLGENKHFAAAPAGGSGSNPTGGRSAPMRGDVAVTSGDEDLAVGWNQPAAGPKN